MLSIPPSHTLRQGLGSLVPIAWCTWLCTVQIHVSGERVSATDVTYCDNAAEDSASL